MVSFYILMIYNHLLTWSDRSWNSTFWSVIYSLVFFNHLLTDDKKFNFVWLMMWKLDYFTQNIWRSQIGLRTGIFGYFLHFDNVKPFTYLSRKFRVWGSLYENLSILARIFEEVRLVLEPQFLVSFFILMICKYLLTCDKNFQL